MTKKETADRNKQIADRTAVLLKEIMPQIGGIVIQDFMNLNDLCMLVEQRRKDEAPRTHIIFKMDCGSSIHQEEVFVDLTDGTTPKEAVERIIKKFNDEEDRRHREVEGYPKEHRRFLNEIVSSLLLTDDLAERLVPQ